MIKFKRSTKEKAVKYFCCLLICALMLFILQPLFPALNSLLDSTFTGENSLSIINLSDKVSSQTRGLENTDSTYAQYSANDYVSVIIEAEGTPLIDKYKSANFKNLTEYASATAGKRHTESLLDIQYNLQRRLQANFNITFTHSYTGLLNGFAAEIQYKDYRKLKAFSGVSSVSISKTYSVPKTDYASVYNEVNVYGTGIYDSSEVAFDGSGTVVAVFDTGFDYTHPAFQTMPDSLALTKDKLSSVFENLSFYSKSRGLSLNDVYLNDKVPFAFDYADNVPEVFPKDPHGTHVAGIIAGYDPTFQWKPEGITDSAFRGVAPGAQLAIFKVFSSGGDAVSASSTNILVALEDAALLGVDVINMSLGSAGGFETEDSVTDAVYEKLRSAGISVIVSAGNEGNSASGSSKGSTNLVSNPDSGTMGSPASYSQTMAVASISGVMSDFFIANGETVGYIYEASDVNGKLLSFAGTLLGSSEEKTFEYVTVPGVGNSSNFAAVNVLGKIALVKRGSINFDEKIRNAHASGAVGIIIYNNISGGINISAGRATMIPSCSIPMDIGNELAKKSYGTLVLNKSNKAGPFISNFSSWGVIANLELKPEITAHGGSITSTVPGGYDSISGTSMAAPNMAGAMTIIRQYLKEKFPSYNAEAISALANRLVMSTATIARNDENNPYSPRKQGAGLASLYNVVNAGAYLYVDGSDKAKISAGDDKNKAGIYELAFKIQNMSGISKSYTINTETFTESVSTDGKTVTERAYMLNGGKVAISVRGGSLSGNTVSVGGYGSAEITVRISLTDAEKKYIDEKFINGMFVDGFISLDSLDGDIDLSIPWVAFYGDWLKAPLFDATAYEVSESLLDSSVADDDKLKEDIYASKLYGKFDMKGASGETEDGYWGLGEYLYVLENENDKPLTTEDKSAITQNSDGIYELDSVALGTLRGAKTANVEVINALSGEVIYSNSQQNIRKAVYNSGSYIAGSVDLKINVADYKLANNTKYTVNVTGLLDYGDGGLDTNLKNTYSSSFYVDSESPILVEDGITFRIEERNGVKRYYVDMEVYDNHYIQGMYPGTFSSYDQENGELVDFLGFDRYLTPVDSRFGAVNKITYEITSFFPQVKANGNQIYLEFIDYAKNASYWIVTLPENPTESVTFKSAELSMDINKMIDLKEEIILNPEGAWKYNLHWASANESIVSVVDGVITAVSQGETTVTVTAYNSRGKDVTASVKIKVSGNIHNPRLEKLTPDVNRIDAIVGDTGIISIDVFPFNYLSADLKWTSSNSLIVDIQKVEGTNTAEFTVLGYNTEPIRITVVDTNTGTLIRGIIEIGIRQPFKTESVMLTSYTGKGTVTDEGSGIVIFPEELDIFYIGAAAFSENTDITKVIIPEGVKYIEVYAFAGCTNLREVVLPKSLDTINKAAFMGCNKLTKINLENVKTIGAYAFSDTSLENADFSNTNFIGEYAFYGDPTEEGGSYARFSDIDLRNVKFIGKGAFAMCVNLQEVVVSVTKLNDETFAGCIKLRSIVFLNKVAIGNAAFYLTENLTDVRFNKGCQSIGSQAFAQSGLTSFVLADGLEKIGGEAFYSCLFLSEIIISAGALLSDFGGLVFYGAPIERYIVEEGNNFLKAVDGILYDITGTKLISYPYNKTVAGNTFTVPSEVKIIGQFAFSGVASITTINLNNVEKIEDVAFFSMENLATVVFNGKQRSIGGYAFASCGKLNLSTLNNAAGLESIGEYAFSAAGGSLSSTVNLILPSRVKNIGVFAFDNCSTISSVDLSNTQLTYLAEGIFNKCGSLSNIVFGDEITHIGVGALAYCSSLTAVIIPDSVAALERGVFFDCVNLYDVTLPSNITAISELCFSGTAIVELYIPESVTSIGSEAFYGAELLASFTGAELNNITEIGDYAFAFTSLTELIAPEVITVGMSLFTDYGVDGYVLENTNLVKVYLPKALHISESAFWHSVNLSDADISSAEFIGEGAFMNCTSLAEIEIDAAKSISEYAFAYTKIKEISLGAGIEKVEERSFIYMDFLEKISVVSGGGKYFDKDGVLYSHVMSGGYQLDAYPSLKEGTKYSIIDGTVRIAAAAFDGNENLFEVILPRTLKAIGDRAFSDTNIRVFEFKSISMPVLESYLIDISGGSGLYLNYHSNFGISVVDRRYFGYILTPESVGLVMVSPSNGIGYDNYILGLFFDHLITGSPALSDAAIAVINLIANLPTIIALEHKPLVLAARSAYDGLLRAQQALITNYDRLEASELALSLLENTGGQEQEPPEESNSALIIAYVFIGIIGAALIALCVFYALIFKKLKKVTKKSDDGDTDSGDGLDTDNDDSADADNYGIAESEISEAQETVENAVSDEDSASKENENE